MFVHLVANFSSAIVGRSLASRLDIGKSVEFAYDRYRTGIVAAIGNGAALGCVVNRQRVSSAPEHD
jgi:hypothetical protein